VKRGWTPASTGAVQAAEIPLAPILEKPMSRDRFEKIMAVAVNPGAYEGEAIAALRKARELVKQDPSLGHPVLPTEIPPKTPDDHSFETRLTNVSSYWQDILVGSLSAEAYGLGLRSKFGFDFKISPTALDVRCDGPKEACDAFKAHLEWVIAYINAQPPKP
jgi:hypothetical protein